MSKTSSGNHQTKVKKLAHLALGGTFDHLHRGHRGLLNRAFELSSKVTVGITSDALAFRIHKDPRLESFKVRMKGVVDYLSRNRLLKTYDIITLEDPFGKTVSDDSLEALLITDNTKEGGKILNRKRMEQGLRPLKLIRYPLIRALDGKIISSRRIRDGEIDREGIHFASVLLAATPAEVPGSLLPKFRTPFGNIIPTNPSNLETGINQTIQFIEARGLRPLTSVGDLVSYGFLRAGVSPKLIVADLKVNRKKRFEKISDLGSLEKRNVYRAANPPGIILPALVNAIQKAMLKEQPAVIQIDGEEDLAVLPAVLLSPLGAVVVYGHFQHGIVAVEVTEAKKSEALKLLGKLERIDQE